MQRLIYRLIILNLVIYLVATVGMIVAGQLIDPVKTPYHVVRVTVATALDLDSPPDELQARVEALYEKVGARISIYGPNRELIASSIDPPYPYELPDRGLFGGFHDVVDESGETVARVVTAPPLTHLRGQTSRDMLLAWFLVSVIALLISVRASRRLAKPLLAVEDAARRLGRGDLSARASLDAADLDDEFAELGRTFDEMAGRLSTLLRSQRELLASVSHEFRTPLARMRVVSEMLAEGDDVRELLPELDTDIGELDRLVGRLLESVTLELEAKRGRRGASAPELHQRCDAGELVERAAARFGLVHPERALELELGEDALAASVELDPDALLRALDKLLDNAQLYSPADALISVRAWVESPTRDPRGDPHLVIEVVDRGVGIAAQDLPLVFNPFFRADRSRARHSGGLGLGLAMCRSIVESQGGRLSARSSLDVGSSFRVELPLAAGPG